MPRIHTRATKNSERTATDNASLSVTLLVALFFFGCAAPTASLDPKPLFDPNPLLALDPLFAPAHLLAPSPLLSPLKILDQTPLLSPIKILEPAPLLAPPNLK